MLKELHISNYRLFDELHIPDLGQVNLIAGKNNTGKTALLEALRIWASTANQTVINNILYARGEFGVGDHRVFDELFNYSALMNSKSRTVSLKIDGIEIKREVFSNSRPPNFEVFVKELPKPDGSPWARLDAYVTAESPDDFAAYLPFLPDNTLRQKLWDKIVLTPSEEDVVKILKIIDSKIARIDVKPNSIRVKHEDFEKPVPLGKFGDGVRRLLDIGLVLANSQKKLLLVDEFESGLHYSVQENLWERIFQYAKEWKIQVFVTTHSIDTVRTFQSVADRPENQGEGRFFRLQRNNKGKIEAVTYDEEELATAIEFDLETR